MSYDFNGKEAMQLIRGVGLALNVCFKHITRLQNENKELKAEVAWFQEKFQPLTAYQAACERKHKQESYLRTHGKRLSPEIKWAQDNVLAMASSITCEDLLFKLVEELRYTITEPELLERLVEQVNAIRLNLSNSRRLLSEYSEPEELD